MKVTTHLEVHRNFPLPGYSTTYTLEGALTPGQFPVLVDAVLQQLVPREVWRGETLHDVKGREGTSTERHPGDILFSIEGNTFIEGDIDAEEMHDFRVECRTKFVTFEGNHHILYQPTFERLGALPLWLDVQAIPKAFPLELTHLHLDLEFFRSSFISNMLGFAPSVTDELHLAATPTSLRLEIHGDSIKTRESPPLHREELFLNLDAVLSPLLGMSVAQDYDTRAKKR